jgi:hypothetical protein
MMGTEMVPEASVIFNQVTKLIAEKILSTSATIIASGIKLYLFVYKQFLYLHKEIILS